MSSGVIPLATQPIDTVRISITNDCNLSCVYCQPLGRAHDFRHAEQLLQPQDLQKLVKGLTALGVRRVIIGGGEPLLRKDCANLIKAVAANRQIHELRLVTNGTYFKSYADALYKIGLRQLEVNLDTLNFAKYQKITGRDNLYRVLDGIRKAEEVGYNYIRLNVLVLRGVNDEELIDFAVITKTKPYHLYFCEYRPRGSCAPGQIDRLFYPWTEIKRAIDHFQPIYPFIDGSSPMDGSTTRYRFQDAVGSINFWTQSDVTRWSNRPRLLLNCAGEICLEAQPEKRYSLLKYTGKEGSEEKLIAALQRLLTAGEGKMAGAQQVTEIRKTKKTVLSANAKRRQQETQRRARA